MKVLHVVTGLAAGGAERQLHLLLRHLPDRHACEVAVLTNPGTVADALRADGFAVHDLAMRGNRDLAVLPRLARLVRSRRYDAVHTHLYRAGLYGRLAARLAGVRTVLATEHSLQPGVIEGRPAGRGVRALYLAAERLGSTTVAVSGQVAAALHDWGVPSHRVHLLPNGIEPARYVLPASARAAARAALGLPADAFVVGAVGGWCPASGSTSWWRPSPGSPPSPVPATPGCCWWAPAPNAGRWRRSPPGGASPAVCCSPANATTSPNSSPPWTCWPPRRSGRPSA